jgi:hypothetical protein
LERLLPNSEAAGKERVIGLRREPRQQHRADMMQLNAIAVVDE